MTACRYVLCTLAFLLCTLCVRARKKFQYRFEPNGVLPYNSAFGAIKVCHPRPGGDTAFRTALEAYGRRLLDDHAGRGDDTLLIVLQSTYLIAASNESICSHYADADFFAGKNDRYRLLFSADSLYEAYSGTATPDGEHDVVETWPILLGKVWYDLLSKAVPLSNDTGSNQPVYSLQEACGRIDQLHGAMPVFQTKKYPKGIYFTYEEFIHLKPGLAVFRETDNESSATNPHRYYRLDEEGKKGELIPEHAFYAVFNGARWYKTERDGIAPLHCTGEDCSFTTRLRSLKGVQHQSFLFLPGAGLLGGALAGLAVYALSSLDTHIDTGNNRTAIYDYRMKLDIRTGASRPHVRLKPHP